MRVSIISQNESKANKILKSLQTLNETHEFSALIISDLAKLELPDSQVIILIGEKNNRKAFSCYQAMGLMAKTRKWIFVSDNYTVEDRKEMKASGHISFVYQDSPVSIILGAIEISLDNGVFFDPGFNGKKMQDPSEDLYQKYNISVKEYNVIRELVVGKNAKEIALKLGISTSTVETHRKNIYKKLGIHKILQLAQIINEFDD